MSPDELEILTARVFAAADPNLVEELRTAVLEVEALPTDSRARLHAGRGARALNIASALMERYELDGTAIDHRRALSLLQASLDDAQASAE